MLTKCSSRFCRLCFQICLCRRTRLRFCGFVPCDVVHLNLNADCLLFISSICLNVFVFIMSSVFVIVYFLLLYTYSLFLKDISIRLLHNHFARLLCISIPFQPLSQARYTGFFYRFFQQTHLLHCLYFQHIFLKLLRRIFRRVPSYSKFCSSVHTPS